MTFGEGFVSEGFSFRWHAYVSVLVCVILCGFSLRSTIFCRHLKNQKLLFENFWMKVRETENTEMLYQFSPVRKCPGTV